MKTHLVPHVKWYTGDTTKACEGVVVCLDEKSHPVWTEYTGITRIHGNDALEDAQIIINNYSNK